MNFFKRASIKRKQIWIMMAITTVALLLACAGFTAYEVITFRSAMVQNLSTLAEIVGDNSSAALDFNDSKSAEESLAALHAEPHIIGAAIYNKDGKLFASFDRPSDGRNFQAPPTVSRHAQESFLNGDLVLLRPIVSKNEVVGVVYLVSDIQALYARLAQYAAIVAGVFLATLLVNLALASQLQRFVSEPLRDLARIARAVALEKNYSVRAPAGNPDEIGVLIAGFNEMLTQIQERDANLESRVAQRTQELQSEVAERKQTQAELARERDLLRSLMNNTTDLIYFKDAESRLIDWSKSLEVGVGLSAGEILGRTVHEFFQKDFADQVMADDQEMLRTGRPILGKTERSVARNGKATWLLTSKMPMRDSKGAIVGTFGISKDITTMKEAEASLSAAHKELVDASRRAGMAEVATSVLHNVGNVLNSINVSTTLVFEAIKNSKIKNVGRFATLIHSHKDNLPAFFTSDPRGQHIPGFLVELANCLDSEQALWLKEVEATRKNVDHIKDIIAMQQSYARVSGVVDRIHPLDLMEDAVRMNATALTRHDVQLTRDFESGLPDLMVDKHKVLQVLINLIRNAKYACDESGRTDKRLTLQLRHVDGAVRFAVIDNGVGIPPENMMRIFNHGFTTRETGHGFGLHSGALAAKDLGGSLHAESEGPGRGATFTLVIPVERP